MCMISVVTDYGRNIPIPQWTPPSWAEFQELLEKVRKIDAMLNQPHCEDPAKAAWMREVEERMKKLEDLAQIDPLAIKQLKNKPKIVKGKKSARKGDS